MIDLQHVIETKRELPGRETYSRNPVNYSEGMSEDQKDRYIQYLAGQNQDLRLTEKAMQLVLEDFMARQKALEEQLASFQSAQAAEMAELKSRQSDLISQLSEERKLRQSAERKVKSLQEKLDYANQERFGDRRQKVRKKTSDDKPENPDPDREREKEDYDGTDGTLRTDSVDGSQSRDTKEDAKKERDLSNRPDGYKTMGVVGEPVEHPSDLTKVPGRIIERRMVRVFSFRTFLAEERFEMLPIDNNLAERTIRKLTTQRNNSYHYGSDGGAEMAATYHSVISTVKLHGSSVWNFIGTFFKKIFNGCRDYVNMVPARIALAASQC